MCVIERIIKFMKKTTKSGEGLNYTGKRILYKLYKLEKYEGESIIIRNAVSFVCLFAELSFSRSSLGVVSFLSLLHKFQVARSVPLLQP
jgi:hypothetical protein